MCIRDSASPFAHGDVVRGIETGSGEVAKRANAAPFVKRSDGIAAILDQPEIVFGGQLHDGIEIEWIAESVRQHDGPGAIGDSRLQLGGVDVVSRNLHVNKDRDKPVLNNGIDSRGESGGYGDHFVSGRELAVAERRRCETRERREVGGRTGVDEGSACLLYTSRCV